jgi:hypothetical protein
MSAREYVFGTQSSQNMTYVPPKDILIYHQICSYPNPKTHMYCVRTLKINGNNEIIQRTEKCYNKRMIEKYLKSSRGNDYKLYSTYDLNSINLPSCGELLIARSELLTHDYEYTGYATI